MAISNSGVGIRPGVCTSTTRPTAPYEGQMIYETDTDLTYIWGGSAWQQVSGGTAVGNSGLVYVTSVAVGSGVNTVTVANCFSSTYDNYLIKFDPITMGSSGNSMWLKLIPGSGSTTYNSAGNYQAISSGTAVNVGLPTLGDGLWLGVSSSKFSGTVELFYPNKAEATFHSMNSQGTVHINTGSGFDSYTTASTGFTLNQSVYAMTGGTVTVYGYRK